MAIYLQPQTTVHSPLSAYCYIFLSFFLHVTLFVDQVSFGEPIHPTIQKLNRDSDSVCVHTESI